MESYKPIFFLIKHIFKNKYELKKFCKKNVFLLKIDFFFSWVESPWKGNHWAGGSKLGLGLQSCLAQNYILIWYFKE